MRLRLIRRAVALGFVLVSSILRFWLIRLRGPLTHEQRAHWVQSTCVRVLRSMEIRCEVEGAVPAQGLVVSNHLSYLDILILSAAMPCFFVAKAEIDAWPYFGKAARVGGTIFIDRSSLASAERVTAEVAERLSCQFRCCSFQKAPAPMARCSPSIQDCFNPQSKQACPLPPPRSATCLTMERPSARSAGSAMTHSRRIFSRRCNRPGFTHACILAHREYIRTAGSQPEKHLRK